MHYGICTNCLLAQHAQFYTSCDANCAKMNLKGPQKCDPCDKVPPCQKKVTFPGGKMRP